MVKIVTVLAASALLAGMAVSAQAQDAGSTYLQVGGGQVDADGEKFGVIQAAGGYNFNRNFAVEAEFGLGLTEKTYRVGTVNVDAKIKHTAGIYLVGSAPIGENLDLVGRVGFSQVSVEASSGNVSADDSDTGPAYSVGLRYFPKGGVHGIRGDFTRYQLDDGSMDAVQVSYVRRF
ncbi:porin family protein [Asticcacaulis sp. BYS171W]|uniref:Porin family protein n=1 Tax=Asticcacaulis aquaticus TaxID=2984212 RepID=A0ABT5HQS7_9CAUL|nr:porin family protein [Asticcacaulis aquaticus]MDC7682425.1 porin family protein [Asticcacaulis aquaticus]